MARDVLDGYNPSTMKKMKAALILFLTILLPAAGAEEGLHRILLLTPDAERGEHFRDFFQAHGIACTVAGYDKATKELIGDHDLMIADTPEGPQDVVLGKSLGAVQRADFPVTDKPVLGIGYWGYLVLGRHGAALGKVFT